MSENSVTLENLISAYITAVYKDVPPTDIEFNTAADLMRNANAAIAQVTDEEFDILKKRLRESIIVTLDTGVCLTDKKNGHKSWLPARYADMDFFYWERYKRYLEEVKHWNPRVTSKLGKVSDEILDLCIDPDGADGRIRGLVLGDVQSGKTSNFTALANKAADAGYELIIVFAGMPELLRQQTQKRLDVEFCGRKSNVYLNPKETKKNIPIGVGRYGNKKKIATFTQEANDFDEAVLRSNNLALDSVKDPILIVVKKNKTILENVYKWLKNNNELDSNGQISKPVLLIDDEADNASVNTKKDTDDDPTAINAGIRNILRLFSKVTYLAVTATPFANIFINHEVDDDLFPADFIYALEAPSNYIGAERIFGRDSDQDGMLVQINVKDFFKFFPEKHKKELEVNDLPADLYESLYYFLLTNAIRDIRGDKTEHRSMMIHVSRFVNVQKQIAEIVNAWLDQVKSDVRNYAKLSLEESERISTIHDLHMVWDKYSCSELSGVEWDEVLKKYMYKAIATIDVRAVNGMTGSSSLDYDYHKEDGLRVIAVGGNTLSRGLTLEGLVVTYFYRNTNMYDTLLQMGRWFGYRPNYSDLVRIWLSQEAIDWYGQITEASADLRSQILKMRDSNLRPADFGLKVKQDPGALIVTAKNKMRTATTINCPVSISGHLLETPRLIASNDILENNAKTIEKFIDRLSYEGKRVSKDEYRTGGHYFWEDVSGDFVSELLRNFSTHPWHLSYNGKALAEYISNHQWKNGWDVVIIDKGEGEKFTRKLKCGDDYLEIENTESRKISQKNNILSVSGSKLRVGSGGCAKIGLSKQQCDKAVEKFMLNYSGRGKKPSIPDSAYLKIDRKPILMIHVIKPTYLESVDGDYPDFIYAIGVGIPSDGEGDKVAVYQVNLVELKNWINTDDEMDE